MKRKAPPEGTAFEIVSMFDGEFLLRAHKGQEIATFKTKKEAEEALVKYINTSYDFYDATGKHIGAEPDEV